MLVWRLVLVSKCELHAANVVEYQARGEFDVVYEGGDASGYA